MRVGAVLGLGLTVGALLSAGCAAGNNTTNAGGSGGQGASGGSGGGNGGHNTTDPNGGAGPGGGGQGGFEACNKFTAAAEQAPAAMLIALDKSASMNQGQKWGTAQLSVVAAIDKDVFDDMTLGLVTFPTTFSPIPACLCEPLGGPGICDLLLPQGVSCGVSALPQVALAPSGKDKSNAGTGVRHQIYQYLVSTQPQSNQDDGSPVYDAMVAGYSALKLQNIDRRILVVITDGGFSCTSVTNRPGYQDANGCPDWEYPSAVIDLVKQHREDPDKPIYTFIIGVPGSNTTGSDPTSQPPYHMLKALSAYAVAGSPDSVDPACSKDVVFDQSPVPPGFLPCHFDLSGGGSFNADTLATAIQNIKGKALGCVYDLPPPPSGEVIDPTLVNVQTTVNGTSATIPKRSNPSDTCLDGLGCWDYNAGNQVLLLGKACEDVTKAQTAKVEIKVGCETVVK